MGQSHKQLKTMGKLLSRLARSKRGNSFMLVAGAMVPIAGVVGGGFDMGRAYLAKSKLQAACDAGALAGRRTMVGNVWNATSLAAANGYFNVNFVNGKYGTAALVKSFNSADGQTVTGTASANVPTTLMSIFGYNNIPVEVACDAVMNLPNTDVMFVLDTTGSMDLTNAGDPTNRITALRNAVTNFYTQVEAAKGASTQVRYGFVPYAQTVNVGSLLQPTWIADQWTYNSRRPDGTDTTNYAGGQVTTKYDYKDETYPGAPYPSPTITNLPLESCSAPASTYGDDGGTVLSSSSTPWAGPPSGTQITTRYRFVYHGNYYGLNQSATVCQLHKYDFTGFIKEFTQVSTPDYTTASSDTAYNWRYDSITYDTSALTVGGSLTTNTGWQHSAYTSTWNGCIEERATAKHASYDPIPADAYDMQIDLVPNGDARTQWGPYLPGVVWSREGIGNWSRNNFKSRWDTQHYLTHAGGALASCPTASRRLDSLSSSALTTYLNSLVASGNTHHDIGMVWGARLLSPTGLFAADNATTPTGGQISRHIIFMTDGDTNSPIEDYDAYGITALDRRRSGNPAVLPTLADMNSEVDLRFDAICKEVKRKNITIWTIAFGTALTPLMSSCASSPANAFQANDTTALNTAFSEIASKIANLRLNR